MLIETPFLRKSAIAVGIASAVTVTSKALAQRFIFKYPQKDASVKEPLPDGSFPICPFKKFMDNPRESSPSFGPGYFFYRRSKRLKHSRIWKFLNPNKTGTVVVSGYKNAKAMLNMEFSSIQGQVVPFSSKVVGTDSLRVTEDRKEHQFLRKLVGAGMTPSNVATLIPALQQTAEKLLKKRLNQREWKMHEMCTEFTLDVAMELIVGLELKDNDDESDLTRFREALADWLGGIFSADVSKALEARDFLVARIKERIQELRNLNLNDGSTLAAMVFAEDEENRDARLTEDQIIDNTLLLILAGSETSAGTLTICMLLLGLHPETYTLLVEEQKRVVEEYGQALSKQVVDKAMPQLDSVVKESLRIRPIVGGSMRGTKETVVIDGRQVPAGWSITYDRHLTHLLDPATFCEDESHMDILRGFAPERWMQDTTRPTEFIPFGVGPRYCLGADLAMAEMKVFLSILIRRLPKYDLVYPAKNEPIIWKEKCIVPIPKDGVIIDASAVTASLS